MDFKLTIENYLNQLKNDENLTLYGFIVSLIIVLITITIIRLVNRKKHGRNVLMVGLSESGKTLLFTQLYTNKFVQTVTSMKANEALIELENGKKKVTLIDLPGYERLRNKYFDDYKGKATAILFTVDSTKITANIKDVAELLYQILSDPVIKRNGLPILIACNKQDDKIFAKSAKSIQIKLEKELNAIRSTKLKALSDTDDSATQSSASLGDLSKQFAFTHIKSIVEFVDCSAKNNDYHADIDNLRKWLAKVV